MLYFDNYLTPKLSTQRVNVVLRVVWRQKPGVNFMGSYPNGASF